MRNVFLAFCLILVLAAIPLMAQEKTTVTVKASEINNGVVILNIQQAAAAGQEKASFVLHCNKGTVACKALEPGDYLMVRLPKNWGIYDCNNVDLYPTTANPDTAQKLGEYCLLEK